MKSEYINPFIAATCNVFETMFSCQLSRGKPTVKADCAPLYEVTGIIGLSGNASGMVVVSLSKETALSAAEKMLGLRPPEIDADVIDAIGEIANMIAGAAKAQLEQYCISISLPSVVTGKSTTIGFPSNSTPITIPFACKWGPLVVEVALVAEPAMVAEECVLA